MHLQVCEQLRMGSMVFLSHDIKVYIAQFSIFKTEVITGADEIHN